LLQALLAEPYVALPPPKSTGRELFNLNWVRSRIAGRALDPRDVQATLTRLSATVIAQAIERHFPAAREVLACGGGARNPTLMRMLAEECAPRSVASTETLGVAPEHVEALAFAWLAQRFVEREPGNAPAVTGARGARILGALYPK
jgi:anhydro-N-acetylmuramic acid kinase